jgi:WD40 repeat protein
MARIFISHSSANNAEAVALRDWLAGEGWDDVFLDLDPERGIVACERWERVAFSPDGARVLTGSLDNTARLWDAETGQELRAFEGHEERVKAVAFSPDGARVLTGSADKTARLWDISAIPQGTIFDIACARLPDHDLAGLGKDYGLDLSRELPICPKDASGRFTTPLPDPAMTK